MREQHYCHRLPSIGVVQNEMQQTRSPSAFLRVSQQTTLKLIILIFVRCELFNNRTLSDVRCGIGSSMRGKYFFQYDIGVS